jgi:hypothetical protein
MNDDNPTGEVGPLTEDRSKAPQTALTSPMGNPGLGMNCFTPGDQSSDILALFRTVPYGESRLSAYLV